MRRTMATSNPVLSEKALRSIPRVSSDGMTAMGAATKTIVLLMLLMVGASWAWMKTLGQWEADISTIYPWVLWSSLGAFVIAMVTTFKKEWSPVTAPLYAVVEGVAIGSLSALMEVAYPGIVLQAVALTFGVALVMFTCYRTGLIRPTEKFVLGVTAATGGIALIYLVSFGLGFFGISVPFIHEGGIWGILFSVFVVVIAALNLILDFGFLEQGEAMGLPKYMEWYGAFGLMVTLVWLYLEILRLLAKTRER